MAQGPVLIYAHGWWKWECLEKITKLIRFNVFDLSILWHICAMKKQLHYGVHEAFKHPCKCLHVNVSLMTQYTNRVVHGEEDEGNTDLSVCGGFVFCQTVLLSSHSWHNLAAQGKELDFCFLFCRVGWALSNSDQLWVIAGQPQSKRPIWICYASYYCAAVLHLILTPKLQSNLIS